MSIANGKGTDSGCLFRMESLLISIDVYQDLGKLHMTISCQNTPKHSSPYPPHLAGLGKAEFVFPKSASMLGKVEKN